MKHAALYRKWRPRRMDQVVGQEPVVRTLRLAIETGRVAHAYLFSGPRGTGKTSTAKVLAMGLNCARGPTPDPDGTCGSCREIINNSSLDVVEMDAASNRGIDEIRDLRDRVNLAPAAGRMKVYIIDEVHMLTPEAFNALLKMLEEPPEHVVFVLATTEKHKVLPTIVSRCQSFDFRRPGVETLREKLAEIAAAEGIEVEPEALTIIAREGHGSFRDAEGLLDQLASFAESRVTAAMVRELLGSVGPETLLEATYALHERRAADSLRIVDRLSNEGRDLGQFVGELISHLRRLMLLPHAPEVALAEVGAEERGRLEEQASSVPTVEVVRIIEGLDDTLGRIKRGGDPKLELELAFLKLTRDYVEPSIENLLRRLERLEQAAQTGAVPGRAPEAPPRPDNPGHGPQKEPAALEEMAAPETEAPDGDGEEAEARDGSMSAGALAERWMQIMEDLKRNRQALTATVFQEGRPVGAEDNVLTIEFPADADFHAREARKSRHSEALADVLEEHFGARPRLECRVAGDSSETPPRGEPGRETSPQADEHGAEAGPAGGDDGRAGADAADADDTIRSEAEVFEVAREWRGSRDGGS